VAEIEAEIWEKFGDFAGKLAGCLAESGPKLSRQTLAAWPAPKGAIGGRERCFASIVWGAKIGGKRERETQKSPLSADRLGSCASFLHLFGAAEGKLINSSLGEKTETVIDCCWLRLNVRVAPEFCVPNDSGNSGRP